MSITTGVVIIVCVIAGACVYVATLEFILEWKRWCPPTDNRKDPEA